MQVSFLTEVDLRFPYKFWQKKERVTVFLIKTNKRVYYLFPLPKLLTVFSLLFLIITTPEVLKSCKI